MLQKEQGSRSRSERQSETASFRKTAAWIFHAAVFFRDILRKE
ncbi:hypothetical protein GCWU000341_00722 [Oribacterium sp. oral taxon 078 str. F0262]|nr:hypothetical protein GCWU000341_00722 [Oribacterium sp. oral taxon 078 str. F0262]